MERTEVRKFREEDRAAVRRIAADTADAGRPVEGFFRDRELMADLLTGYYLDCEPGSAWVAVDGGEVVGYLTGCLDTLRSLAAMRSRVAPRSLLRALGRRAFWTPDTVRAAAAGVLTWLRGGTVGRRYAGRYPAHLHVNLAPGSRGGGLGAGLVARFAAQAAASGVRGIHLSTRGDNEPAHRFFERQGFTLLGRHPLIFPAREGLSRRETWVFGRAL